MITWKTWDTALTGVVNGFNIGAPYAAAISGAIHDLMESAWTPNDFTLNGGRYADDVLAHAEIEWQRKVQP